MALIDDIKKQAESCGGATLEGGKTLKELADEAGISVFQCACALSKLEKEGKVESALVRQKDGNVRKVFAEKAVKKEEQKKG